MFRKALVVALAALATAVSAGPVPRASTVTDVQVFQFALTLEHLEDAFYTAALAKFTAKDFVAAGYPSWVHGRFAQIAGHERTHVKYLTEMLGPAAVPPCTYDFGNTLDNPTSFAKQSRVFETVGTSAYLGGTAVLQDKTHVTEAWGTCSILAVEISQAGWVSSSVLKQQPWNGPFTIPLTPSAVYSLARSFIKSCPLNYPELPVKPLPSLSLSNPAPQHGESVKFSFPEENFNDGKQYYAAWLDGLTVTYTEIASDGSTKVPEGLLGIVYVATVSSKDTPSDDNLTSGFALIAFDFNSSVDDSKAGSPV
ncbi:ferritin-like domain-containing protein [Ganoderma leucocontextum]|nr:ferritin-like domain-containing protein [Ganoderma leucocontextum]